MDKKHRPKGQPRVSKEVKEQILKRIKEEGAPVAQAASEHGLKPKIISTTGFPAESRPRPRSWRSPN